MHFKHNLPVVLLLIISIASPLTADITTVTDDESVSFDSLVARQAERIIGSADSVWVSYTLTVRPEMADIVLNFATDSRYYIRHGEQSTSDDGLQIRNSTEKQVLMKFRRGDYHQPVAIRLLDSREEVSFSGPAVAIASVSDERSFGYARQQLERTSREDRRAWMALVALHRSDQAGDVLLRLYRQADADEKKSALFWYSQTLDSGELGQLPQLYQGADESLRGHFAFIFANLDSDAGFDKLVEMAREASSDAIVEKAVFWIGQSDRPEALSLLRDMYQEGRSRALKEKVIFAISQHDSEEAGRYLQAIAREAGEAEMRAKAIFWLGQREGDGALALLGELYEQESSQAVRGKILFSYSQVDTPESLEMLKKIAAEEPSHALREKAIFWIGRHNDTAGALKALQNLYAYLDARPLKKKVIFSVSQISGQAAEDFLARLVREEQDQELRQQSLFWLVQSSDNAVTVDLLKSLYAEEKSFAMKEKIIFNLSQIRSSDSRQLLRQIASNEQNRELRKKAVFWLSQSGGAEAEKFLEDELLK